MTALLVMIMVGLASCVSSWGVWQLVRHNRARNGWYREQPDWWRRPIAGPGLRQSVRPIEDRPAAELVEIRDVRIIDQDRQVARRTRRRAVHA